MIFQVAKKQPELDFLVRGAVRGYCPLAKNSKCPTFCRRILQDIKTKRSNVIDIKNKGIRKNVDKYVFLIPFLFRHGYGCLFTTEIIYNFQLIL